jgi:hypothetical protein
MLLNVQIVKDMGKPKTIWLLTEANHNAQVKMWQTGVTVRAGIVTSIVSYVTGTIPQITRDVLSTKR